MTSFETEFLNCLNPSNKKIIGSIPITSFSQIDEIFQNALVLWDKGTSFLKETQHKKLDEELDEIFVEIFFDCGLFI